jgi:hypothetical protein
MIFNDIHENRERFLNGKFNCIPFTLDRFSDYAPGIIRGNFDCVTANSSVGKTTLTKYLYVFSAIEFAIKQKLNFKIIYFALEESEQQFDYSLLSYIVKKKLGLRYNITEFEAFNSVIPDADMFKIDNLKPVFEEYKSYVQVVDNVYNSYGLYKHVREFARGRGTFYMNETKLTTDNLIKNESWNGYEPHDPEEFVIVVTDHVSELHFDKDNPTLFDAIASWTKNQRHYICKRFNYNCCAVQQQAAAQESLDNFKHNKLKPSLNGLADNKLTGRSYMNVYGLFAPDRHDIENYQQYETSPYFRTITVVKQRYGHVGAELPVFFDGKTNYMRTMPKVDKVQEVRQVYDYIKTLG